MKRLALLMALFIAFPAFGATCKVSEYANMITDQFGRTVPVAAEPVITTQNVTYTTSTQTAAALNSKTRFVRIVCDAKAHFVFAVNPTAAATDPYLAADTPEYFGISPTGTYKIAFYDGSSS